MVRGDYGRRRAEINEIFERAEPADETVESVSPDGRFLLEVTRYSTGPNTWAYSRGVVTRRQDDKLLADVKRNLGSFWHTWVSHPNGKSYLLCGEDYQGYSCVDLADETYHVYFPPEGYEGHGFCWATVDPSPDGLALAVDGCYWACPYDLVIYDFAEPETLPYREIARWENLIECKGWKDNETFEFVTETQVRKSDGRDYADLTEAEQDELDNNPDSIDFRLDTLEARRPT